MLSAVETFGPASAATHPYAHHHSFAIAAAAAASVPAASAAAAIMPPTHQLQSSLDHYTALTGHHHHHHHHPGHTGLYLSSLNTSTTALPDNLPSSSSSTERTTTISPSSAHFSSGSSKSDCHIAASAAVTMSSTEFARPHPKQPRYSNGGNSITNNNNINGNNNNNNTNSGSNNNNSNSFSNNDKNNTCGVPIHLRNTKHNNSNCLSTSRTKYSNSSSVSAAVSSAIEQTGPVNLVTNNNSSNNNNNNNSSNSSSNNNNNNSGNSNLHCNNSDNNSNNISNSNKNSSSPLSQHHQQTESLSSQQSSSNETDIMAGIYAQKLPFTAPAVVTNSAAAVAAAAYQFNYPHIYGRGAIYGTTALYPGHHPLSSRSQLHNRPTYIGAQHEPFSHYLTPPVTYSPPSVPAPPGLLRPPPPPSLSQPLALATNHHSATSILNSSNSPVVGNPLCSAQISIIPDNRQHSSMHHIPPQPSPQNLSNTERQLSSSLSLMTTRDKDSIKNSNATYINGKVNLPSITGSSNAAGFKVPSGKEGSLKHRILTRPPYSEKDVVRRKSPITAAVVRSLSNSSTPSNFSKGAFIELANGVLRKVEDMRTEDFIQSAEKSPHHQLADSTVVKIINTPSSVIITFSYDKNRSKADVEVSQEHPFFVYGQGWASCNPELSLQTFGLRCQRLQVGDICISLISRENNHNSALSSTSSSSSPLSSSSYSTSIGSSPHSPQSLYSGQQSQHQQQQHYYTKEELSPQNLSRKPSNITSSTIPTTATGTTVASRLSVPPIAHHLPSLPSISSGLPVPLSSSHHPYDRLHPYEVSTRHHSSPPAISNGFPPMSHHHHHHQPQHHSLHQQHHHHHQQQQQYRLLKPVVSSDSSRHTPVGKGSGEMQSPPPPLSSHSTPSSRPPSNQPYYLGTGGNNNGSNPGNGNNEIVRTSSSGSASNGSSIGGGSEQHETTININNEVSVSRKRRWSAPDICDDDGSCNPASSKTMNKNS